jgi:beta-glucosidase/6-phospho-beta-glucosidase/beta-galactosidase
VSRRSLAFPDGFLWDVATAAHQNEGNNTRNDFSAWEQIPGHVADGSTSGLACDWWNQVEWVKGWTTRFGLIALDPATQERTPRRSAELYAEIARANAIAEEMVEKYAPQVMDQVFT